MNHIQKNILRNWADNIESQWNSASELTNMKEHSKRLANLLRSKIDSLHDRDDESDEIDMLKKIIDEQSKRIQYLECSTDFNGRSGELSRISTSCLPCSCKCQAQGMATTEFFGRPFECSIIEEQKKLTDVALWAYFRRWIMERKF